MKTTKKNLFVLKWVNESHLVEVTQIYTCFNIIYLCNNINITDKGKVRKKFKISV